MRKVLYSLIVLAILVGMFVCLGAPAFAADGDTVIIAASDAQLDAGMIDQLHSEHEAEKLLVIDINGLDEEQASDGYDVVYVTDEVAADESYQSLQPNKAVKFDTEDFNYPVILVGVSESTTAGDLDAAVSECSPAEGTVIIAVGPVSTAAVEAIRDCATTFDKFLTCKANPEDDIASLTAVVSGKVIEVGGEEESPLAAVTVSADKSISSQTMKVPETFVESGPVAPSYTITFNPAGGSGDTFTETVGQDQGYSFTFPDNNFTAPEGCTFRAWQNVDDFTDHQPGETITDVSGDMTFQAAWSEPVVEQAPATFSVTFVPGDGATGTPYVVSDVTADSSLGMIEMPSDFAKDGFTFTGWLLDGVHYDVYEPYYVSGETTVTAEWTQAATAEVSDPVKFTVTYNLNGGTNVDAAVNPEQQTIDFTDIPEENRYFGVPDGSWITPPDGQVFDGWLCSLDSQIYKPSTLDDNAAQVHITGDVTFTAQWKEGTATPTATDRPMYKAIFKATAESATEGVDMNSATEEHAGNNIIMPDCTFAAPAENQVFVGWVMEGTDGIYKPNEEYTMTEADVTFVAKWALASAVVTYVADNGTETTHAEPVTLTEGAAQHTLIAQPEDFTAPEGKTFGGWLVGEGNIQQPETAITVTADMQIKAVWNDAAKQQNQDPGATSTGDVNYTQASDAVVTLSYTNASIAAVFVDNAQLVADQDYTLAADGKSFTFINGYLNKLTVGTHTLNVTFQESDTATYKSNTRSLVIAAAPVATQQPVQQDNYKIDWSDRSASVSQTFASAPVKVEIYYGEQANADGSKTPVYREAVRDRDYTVNGNTLTLLPGLINGNWGLWPNATYSLRVTLEDNGIALAAADGTVKNPVTLQISLSGDAPTTIANPSPSPSAVPGNPNVPVTGDETPIVLYIVILVVLIIALAAVLIFVMKRRNAGSHGRH